MNKENDFENALAAYERRAANFIKEKGMLGVSVGNDNMVYIGNGFKISKEGAEQIIMDAFDLAVSEYENENN